MKNQTASGDEVKRQYTLYEVGYIKLRTGMGVLALIFPMIFLISSWVLGRTEMQASLSEYYATRELERNLFVGILICIGIFLWLYEGYSREESWILDIAGILVILVALIPFNATTIGMGNIDIPVSGEFYGAKLSVHGFCAVTFFILIIVVSTYFSGTTLKDRPDKAKWIRTYAAISTWMGVGIALATLSAVFDDSWLAHLFGRKGIFWAETFGVWGFACFWLIKTKEVNPTIEYRPLPLRQAEKQTMDPSIVEGTRTH